jgi:NADH-quinone oxidoreductase subunit C
MTAIAHSHSIERDITASAGTGGVTVQSTHDGVPTYWVSPAAAPGVLRTLRDGVDRPYRMLYDLFAIDERSRRNRDGQPDSDFTLVYHLLSFDRNEDVRVKVPLKGEHPSAPSVTGLWESADWYEREAYDMFGILFSGHPDLRRLLTDYGFQGYPLRKDFPLTGYVEVRWDDEQKRIVYEPVKLVQDFRNFDFLSPWEGMQALLPGDEKAKQGEKH